MTLRELLVAHHAAVSERWDHTARLGWHILDAVTALLSQQAGKKLDDPPGVDQLHPYLRTSAPAPQEKPALKVTGENFQLLKSIFLPP